MKRTHEPLESIGFLREKKGMRASRFWNEGDDASGVLRNLNETEPVRQTIGIFQP
jgi:hypothetical protein